MPRTFDLWHDSYSPIRLAQQYYATLLRGAANQRLLFCWRGKYDSIAQWFAQSPHEVRILRRSVLIAVCWLHQRFTLRASSFPWRLVALGDTRHTQAAQDRLWTEFLETPACCLSPGFARKLQQRALNDQNAAGFQWSRDPFWKSLWFWFARLFTLQIADCEFRHARNRSRNNFRTGLGQFVARYILSEANALHNARAAERHHQIILQ